MRDGDGDRLAAYVDAGVPANLTDAAGNTFKDEPDVVRAPFGRPELFG